MSSYVTSPFVLEERRLQGIAKKCSEDLNIALQNIIEQQNLMKEKEEEQKRIDRLYFVSQAKADNEHRENLLKKSAELVEKKRYLRELLQNIQLELNVFQNGNFEMEVIMERQKQLWYRLENSEENFEELENSIIIHIQEAEKKVKDQSAEKSGRIVHSVESVVTKHGKKGVSLQMNKQFSSEEKIRTNLLDEFVAKMEMAISSQYENRFPSLAQLKSSFDLQPEYARAAFAVNNMQKIDEIIRQLEATANSGKIANDKREKIVLYYRAICNLMHEAVDERLVEDERSTRKLLQTYNDLFKKYQELKKHEYVSAAVADIMERHGISYQDSRNSTYGNIMRFSMDNASVDVSGTENNHLVMEVSGEYSGDVPTLNERRKSVSSAQHLCSLLKSIEAELKAEYGIVFGNILTEQPSEATIVMRRVTSETGDKKYWSEKKQTLDAM